MIKCSIIYAFLLQVGRLMWNSFLSFRESSEDEGLSIKAIRHHKLCVLPQEMALKNPEPW